MNRERKIFYPAVARSMVFVLLWCLLPATLFSRDYTVVSKSALNVRSGAGMNYEITGSLNNGQRVDVDTVLDGWAKINYAGKEGYVSAEYLHSVEARLVTSGWFENYVLSFGEQSIPFIILVCLAVTLFLRLCMRHVPRSRFVTGLIGITIVSGLEWLYFLYYKGDIWFCTPSVVGWGWTIVNFFFFAFVIVRQYRCILAIWDEIKYFDRRPDIRIGVYSYGVAIISIAVFVIMPFSHVYIYVCIGLGLAQIAQIIVNFCQMANWKLALLFSLFYLFASVALLTTFIHFIVLLVVASFVMFVLWVWSVCSKKSPDEEEE